MEIEAVREREEALPGKGRKVQLGQRHVLVESHEPPVEEHCVPVARGDRRASALGDRV